MFINALQRQNPALITAAVDFWRQGKIAPDSYVIDVDRLLENAAKILAVARELNITLYIMTKQLGRNPWLAEKLMRLGFGGVVAVDDKEARIMRRAGIKVAHQGHLVQIPSGQVGEAVEQGTDIITVFSLDKAREIAAAALSAGRVQAIMLKVYGDNDLFYPGQESGFSLAGLAAAVEQIRSLAGITIAGLTHFPCLLWDEQQSAVVPTENLHSLLAAKARLEHCGVRVGQLNAPSATSCLSLPLLKQFNVTHAEPGHALTGTIPANQRGDQPETVAMLWLSEISHHFKGRSYCYGGGYYRRGKAKHALIYAPGESVPRRAVLGAVDDASIDYFLPLEGEFAAGSAAIFCFRTQIFVTRSEVVLIAGLARGAPEIVGRYGSQGNQLEDLWRDA